MWDNCKESSFYRQTYFSELLNVLVLLVKFGRACVLNELVVKQAFLLQFFLKLVKAL